MADWLAECSKRVLMLDGAMGTELHSRGLPPGVCPEQWAREHPLLLSEVHAAYVEAGAEAVITFTLGASPAKLAKTGLDRQTEAINWALARIARLAAPQALVLGDIGPTGEFIAPLGQKTPQEIRDGFARQAAGLADVVDGFIIQTMIDLEETLLALEAARQVAPGKPVLACLTFQKDADGKNYHTLFGNDPVTVTKRLEAAGASAVGSNCGSGIDDMLGVIERMAGATRLPIVVEPNAGLPKLVAGRTVFSETPEEMAAKVGRLVSAGARLVGGCCGTTPRHIAAMKAALAAL
jgi:5-methyltetrahydrofolate--homocysteine methyltransferase